MKLTKEEIKFIDDYLIKNEVVYWDVRLELLDHIVSAVEDKLENDGISFIEALLEVHRGFGNQLMRPRAHGSDLFKKGLYQANNGFKKFIQNKQKEVGKKHRKAAFKELRHVFKCPQFYVEIVIFVAIVSILIYEFSLKIAAFSTLMLLFIPFTLLLFYGLSSKFSRKSIHLNQASLAGMSLLFLFNTILQCGNMFYEEATNSILYLVCTVLIVLSYPLIRAYAMLYIKEHKKFKAYYKSYIAS